MSLSSIFLLALATTAAGQSSRTKPVVMPFGLRYGEHTFGAWFSIPVTVGSQNFELGISTSLSRSWIPGKSMCDGDSNVTQCTETLGGIFDTGKSSTWKADSAQSGVKIEDELLKSFYNKTVSPELMVQSGDSKKLLAMEGVGNVGTDVVTLASNTGSFKMADQTVGVITSGNRELMANGYISLQQMALSLYAGQFTPSPSYHLFQGLAAYTNYTVLDLDGTDYGRYSLIFGGYNSMLDLNTTQQYPLTQTELTTSATDSTPLAPSVALPASETVSYSMNVVLEDIVYRWTEGGGTDNSLLAKPKLAIIDSTTPWIWLPKSTLDSFVSISGAVWNDTYDAYTMPYCPGWDPCTATQERSFDALLDFKFEQMNGDKLTLDFYNYFNVRYLPSNSTDVYTVPVRELPDDADAIILGRPFLAGIHLWVDYAEKYWGMAQGNVTLQHETTSQVVPWDRANHPPITNTTILVKRPSTDGKSLSGHGGPGSPGGGPSGGGKPLGTGVMAGIAAGGGALLLGLAIAGICLFRRRKNKTNNSSNDPNRPDSMIELHAKDGQKVAELPSQDAQFRPHELPPSPAQFSKQPQDQGQFTKLHELPQSQKAQMYQELPNSGPHQQQQQQGYYPPPPPAGQYSHAPPSPQPMYPPPPNYDNGQGGPVYYEMDAGRGH
ncbi:hypothetical protein Q9L58_001988 [Maublancomyces gigas]|uniref:Peptidase A1 domain-containing protein n=1 Tax=Discina gigas TaxID=1032678 RepID=A0ABR3GTA3_9PEZI